MLGELFVALGGLEASLVRFDRTASRIAGAVTGEEDTSELMVQALVHQRDAETQAVSIRVTDELVGTLLDVFA